MLLSLSFIWAAADANHPNELDNAYTALYRGQIGEAERLYRAVQKRRVDTSELLYFQGHLHFARGQYPQAIEAYRLALTTLPPRYHSQVYNNIGNTKWLAGNLQKAIRSYIRALEISEDNNIARYNLEMALRQLQNKNMTLPPPPKKQEPPPPKKQKPPPPPRKQPPPPSRYQDPPTETFRLDDFDRFIPYSHIHRQYLRKYQQSNR